MITKPSIWDYKYDKMSAHETQLNYDRDMMLYEQTVALQKLNGKMDFGDSVALLLTPTDLNDTLPCTEFEPNTKEYNHYEKLRLQRLNLLYKIKNLYLHKGGWLLFTIISNIVFMPITIAVNYEILKVQLILFIFQLFLGMLIISKCQSYRKDADILLDKRNKYVIKCKHNIEKKKQEEIIRNTEHLTFELEDDE